MRLVVTSDTHFPVDITRIPDGDVFVHAGDLMTTGYPDDWAKCKEWLGQLPHQHKYYIPGNHDLHFVNYPGPALQEARKLGVIVLGIPGNYHFLWATLPNGMKMLGLPYVINLPRWAFNATEEYLATHLHMLHQMGHDFDVIISHDPPYGLRDKLDNGKSVGVEAYRKYLDSSIGRDTKIWCTGHIHESYGHMKYNNTDVYNVAMCDRSYKHANPPIVIDF